MAELFFKRGKNLVVRTRSFFVHYYYNTLIRLHLVAPAILEAKTRHSLGPRIVYIRVVIGRKIGFRFRAATLDNLLRT